MPETTNRSLIDFDKGVVRMKGEERLLKKLCSVFVRTSEGQLHELEQALDSQDLSTAQKIAHSIKGGAGTIEAERLHSAAYEMEKAMRANDLNRARNLLPELMDLSRQTRQAILEHYPDLQA